MTEAPGLAVDTGVAVPLLVASHQQHAGVAAWAAGRTLRLSGHALHETHAVLTRLPGDARVGVSDAAALIEQSFADPLVLSPVAVRDACGELASRGIAGGATYDGVVALAAREHDSVLVTRDARAAPTYEALGVTVDMLVTQG